MSVPQDPLPTRVGQSEQRSQTALGLAMLAVIVVAVATLVVAVTLFDRAYRTSGSIPAPATVFVLLTGFVIFSLAHRRA